VLINLAVVVGSIAAELAQETRIAERESSTDAKTDRIHRGIGLNFKDPPPDYSPSASHRLAECPECPPPAPLPLLIAH
jgi:hypothetical protein